MNLADYGIKLKNNVPGNHKVLCPQCSATRKNKTDLCLSVTLDTDGHAVYFCHNCQFTGGTKGATSRKVYRRPGFVPSLQPESSYSDRVVEYFDKRRIGCKTLAENSVHCGQAFFPSKSATVSCLIFPYMRKGEVVNVKYRTSDKHFRQEADAEKIFYGLDHIGETCCIVEGEIDKLSLYEAGITSAISVPDGAPAKSVSEDSTKFEYLKNCESELAKVKRFIIAVDSDAPGMVLEEELARRLGKEKCWRVQWPDGCKDANETLVKHGVEALVACIATARPYPITGTYRSSDFIDQIMDYYENGVSQGAKTGWSTVDENYRVRPGELSVITATPGSGKSEWIDALAMNLAKEYDWKIGVCSFENPKHIHANKLASKYYNMPLRPGYSPNVSRAQIEAFAGEGGWLDEHFHWIAAEEDAPTFDWILEKAKILVFRYGINALVIDPYNEIEHRREHGQTETEYVSQILTKVKRFALNCGVHIWFVAHPAKLKPDSDGNTPVPSLYDISGSANWVNKADVGIVIARMGMTDKVEIHFKKVRFRDSGQIGTVMLRYDKLTGNYSDLSSGASHGY